MGWTAPYEWTAGEVVTAAKLNEQLYYNARYLKGLDGGVTIEDDITIGGNKLLFGTGGLFQYQAAGIVQLRNADDDAYSILALQDLQVHRALRAYSDAAYIAAYNVNNNYLEFQARDTDSGLVEVARLQGAADPYFRMTLPQVLTPGTAPGALVEGHFWYLGADDKLYYRDASANIELVAINGPTRGDILYRAASNWLNLAKGTEGQVLRQGANDPAWASATATQEFMIPPVDPAGNVGDFATDDATAGQAVRFVAFKVPHDFTALTSALVILIKGTSSNVDWTMTTDFGAIDEASTTHSDSATADDLAMVDTKIEDIDVSAAYTDIAADDYVGSLITFDAIDAGSVAVLGLVIKYS